MSTKFQFLGAAPWSAVLWAALAAGPAPAADLSLYGRLPTIERLGLSADGARLAVVVTDGENRLVEVREVDSHKILGGIKAGTQKIRRVQFAGNRHVIITYGVAGYVADVDSPKLESNMAIDYDVDGNRQHLLMDNGAVGAGETLNTIDGYPQTRIVGGRAVAFVQGTEFVASVGTRAVFRIDLDRKVASLETQMDDRTEDWVVGAVDLMGQLHDDGNEGKWSLRRWVGNHWQPIYHQDSDEEPADLLGAGRDGDTFLVRLWKDHKPELREISQDGQKLSEPLPMPGASEVWQDADGSKLIALSELDGDEDRYLFFAPHDQAVWNAIGKAYPGERPSLVDYDAVRDRWIVLIDSPTDGPAYALVDMKTGASTSIGAEYDGLTAKDISPVRAISYKAQDGTPLSGYLTVPAGRPEKALPLVVLVHGGPAARDEPGFDWWSQAMASRGYAVLRVNYRGSEGFGWDFQAKGFGEWGRKMQTDLDDGVGYLVSQGIVDRHRVCIVGASYGGYAALAGAAFGRGLDRRSFGPGQDDQLGPVAENEVAAAETKHYWLRYMGPAAGLDQISPVKHAADITAPVLLIHGKDDTVVAFEQSQMMADALKKAGKPFDFVTLKSEDHWLSRGATRLEMLTAVCDFLEKDNPPT